MNLSATAPSSPRDPIQAEVVIVGAGPCGLFEVFELGLLGIGAHIVDSLAEVGGQCTELYPDKPIYDIPALPVCGAQELVDRLMQQVKPFNPQFHLGQEVSELTRRDDGRFVLRTAAGTCFETGAVVIAAGLGSFQPRRLGVPGCEAFEGTCIHYRIRNARDLEGRRLVLFGKKALRVDTEKFQTSVPGIFAVGDINTYPGKKKLILSGFHEAALAAFAIQHHLYPQKKQFLQYTTTSPIMHKRLGVPD